jgi:LytS/YehU family sensor histidine kinase
MNPHFLFNSLNTLSSLIQEDADKAEEFLDHMSKVYRYLLKNHEEQLVTVETELDFLRSYYSLLHARHSEGLQLSIDVDPSLLDLMIPPMTLQMVLENSLSQNSMSRKEPLRIMIRNRLEQLEVCNNIQPRINQNEDLQEALDNIANKYRLLCQQSITIEVNGKERSICLPLIPNQEMTAV